MATYSKGSLRERSKGHWQARFCRTDRNGSSIVTRSFEATSRRAATLIMEDIRRELIEQDGDDASSRELIAYMLDYVDERERSQQIEASTAANYRSSIKHLARYLEGYSIEEITPENVMDVQAALLADGHVADTVAKDHRFFKQVMDYVCEMGHIHRSPFNKAIKPPKRRKPRPNALDERSRSMLLSVLDASPTTKQSVTARLGLLAGLRREEVAEGKRSLASGGATLTSLPIESESVASSGCRMVGPISRARRPRQANGKSSSRRSSPILCAPSGALSGQVRGRTAMSSETETRSTRPTASRRTSRRLPRR